MLITSVEILRIILCSVFRRHNRLIPGRLVAQRRRDHLLSLSGGLLIPASPTNDDQRPRERAENEDGRARKDTAHPGLQPSEAASEEDTDFRELRPRGIESEH